MAEYSRTRPTALTAIKQGMRHEKAATGLGTATALTHYSREDVSPRLVENLEGISLRNSARRHDLAGAYIKISGCEARFAQSESAIQRLDLCVPFSETHFLVART